MSRRRPMNLSIDAFRNLAAALGIAVLSTVAQAQWTLQAADAASGAAGGANAAAGPLTNLTVNTWTVAEGLSATDNSGKLVRFATRDLVSLSSGRRINGDIRADRWKLALRNGDTLYGEPAGFSGQSMSFKVQELGAVSIPLKSVASLTNPRNITAAKAAPAADKDIVRLANNDHQEGILTNIDGAKVQLAVEGADAPTDIALDLVASVQFGGAAAPRTVPPLSLRLTFASGTTYTVPLKDQSFNWSINQVTIKDAAGTELPISADALASVEVLGGRVVFLTELDPASEEQSTLLGTHWPLQLNRNVLGGTLRVARTDFARGIGVHTRSTLTYELDGSFDTLSLQVGLDDSAAPQGEAIASILLDGKTLWKSDTLKPGQLSPELTLPIAGGKRLELHADPGSHLDVLGRLDWLHPALRRK